MSESEKKVDQSWKDQVEKEKIQAKNNNQSYHEPTFNIFLSSLVMQAMIAMGKMDNPVSGKTEKNMEQARFLVDTIGLLKDKTTGNLSSQEQSLLDDSLCNLRMIYVEQTKQ